MYLLIFRLNRAILRWDYATILIKKREDMENFKDLALWLQKDEKNKQDPELQDFILELSEIGKDDIIMTNSFFSHAVRKFVASKKREIETRDGDKDTYLKIKKHTDLLANEVIASLCSIYPMDEIQDTKKGENDPIAIACEKSDKKDIAENGGYSDHSFKKGEKIVFTPERKLTGTQKTFLIFGTIVLLVPYISGLILMLVFTWDIGDKEAVLRTVPIYSMWTVGYEIVSTIILLFVFGKLFLLSAKSQKKKKQNPIA